MIDRCRRGPSRRRSAAATAARSGGVHRDGEHAPLAPTRALPVDGAEPSMGAGVLAGVVATLSLVAAANREIFGHDGFRGQQESIIQATLCQRDVFVVMPTGGGKSMCFQLPSLLLDGITLVVSPLIALMILNMQNIY